MDLMNINGSQQKPLGFCAERRDARGRTRREAASRHETVSAALNAHIIPQATLMQARQVTRGRDGAPPRRYPFVGGTQGRGARLRCKVPR